VTLAAVVDDVVTRAGAALGATASISDREPASTGDLPHVTVSVAGVDRPHIGIGGLPQAPESGALPVTATIDLADPTLTVGADTITLLDPARTTVIVPNGPIVKADGTDDTPFTAADLTVTGPAGPFTVTDGDPTGQEVRVDHIDGSLRFGDPLPAAGTLTVVFNVGLWDVTVLRFVGTLHLDVTTEVDPAASTVARRLAVVVDELGPPFERLVPTAWGPAHRTDLGDDAALRRRLSYDFAFEQRRPTVGTSGGIIRTVAVTSTRDAPAPVDRVSEEFTIPVSP
jgi:hypothetical protein